MVIVVLFLHNGNNNMFIMFMITFILFIMIIIEPNITHIVSDCFTQAVLWLNQNHNITDVISLANNM